jgi:hypothetical protein
MRPNDYLHPASTGIYQPSIPVIHPDDEYDQTGFDTLWDMQERHFWYRRRHRFLLKAFDWCTSKSPSPLRAIDLGGGVGVWVRYLAVRCGECLQKVALADSSRIALIMAG